MSGKQCNELSSNITLLLNGVLRHGSQVITCPFIMKKEKWWDIFAMNVFKEAYHSSKKTKPEVVDLNETKQTEKEINKQYKTAVTKDIVFITLVALACFTIGLSIGVTLAG